MDEILTSWENTLNDNENQGTSSGTKSNSFLIYTDATVTGFSIKACRGASYAGGTFQVALVSGANPNSGTVHTSDTYNVSDLVPFASGGTFTDFEFTTPYAISSGTTYYLRVNVLTGNTTDEMRWDRTSGGTTDGYPDGTMWSGSTQNTTLDKMFKIYGTVDAHSTDLESGSSQYWSIAEAAQKGLDITGDISISAWIKFESLPSSGNQMIIVGKYGYENNTRSYYFSVHNNSGTYRLRFVTSTNGTSFTEGNVTWSTPTTGVWYHVGVSKSSTTATMYVDGSSIGTATVDSSQHDNSSTFAIGILVGGSGGTDSPFDGLIDEVLIYNAAIGSNMSTNYSSPCAPYVTNAIGQWPFNASGVDLISYNQLANNNTATLSTDVAYTCSVANVSGFFRAAM